jgi:fluoroquinolone resistance protein
MERTYVEDKTFEKNDFTVDILHKAEYDACVFKSCNFPGIDLSHYSFTDCEFRNCNMGMIKTVKTVFRDAKFFGCKLTGIHFENCSDFLFTVYFEDCVLNFSSFYTLKLKKTFFKNCTIQEVDFTDTDLERSVFTNCDLQLSIFQNTNLQKADLRTAYNYSIDPMNNKIKKAKFSVNGLGGLLDKHDIIIEQ